MSDATSTEAADDPALLEPAIEPTPSQLLEEIQTLHDLFKRRLLQDRQKQEMYDKLYAELEAARKAADGVAALPLIRDLMLVLDRFDRYQGPDSEFIDHAAQELLELLRRQGVEPIALEIGSSFDPAVCEIVETTVVDDAGWHSLVLEVVRRGYRHGDRVVRPAHIVLAQAGTIEAADEPAQLD